MCRLINGANGMEVTDNTKTLANALAEIEQLQQKLAAAEDRADKAEAIIREAQEQKPVGKIEAVFNQGAGHFFNCEWFDHCNFKDGDFLYAAPVPAMPIQDELVKGKNYESGLWSMRNYEAWLEDQSEVRPS